MNIVKSAPVLAFLAAVLAGCGKPPVEAMCDTQASCGLLDGQTAEVCTTRVGLALSLLREDASCVALADKFEREMGCASEMSCEDIKKLELGSTSTVTDIPQGTACREEIAAVMEEMASGRCRLLVQENPEPPQVEPPQSEPQEQRRCTGSDCQDGVIQPACDSRSNDDTCIDITTPTPGEPATKPLCNGIACRERRSPADSIVVLSGDDAQTEIQDYQGLPTPSWTQIEAHQHGQK